MTRLFARSVELMEAAGVRPFADWPFRWRVSPAVLDGLLDEIVWASSARYTWDGENRLFGYPLDVDATLPDNSMLLEESTPVR